MASVPIHGMALLNAVRRREEVLDVDDDPANNIREMADGEVWGIPLGAPGEPRRHGRMGQQHPQQVLRGRVVRPPRRFRPGPYGPPMEGPQYGPPMEGLQVPDVAAPAMRIRRESSMVELMNRGTVTPPAEDSDVDDFFNRRTVSPPVESDDDAATVKLEDEVKDEIKIELED